ncbi:hypothetical protein TNCV_2416891 [Trichonephila clavipes]|nr:hypothetical protein TNCV_2416891 [Trichonephila clavipes]
MTEFGRSVDISIDVSPTNTAWPRGSRVINPGNAVKALVTFTYPTSVLALNKQTTILTQQEKKANLPQRKFDIAVPSLSHDMDNSYNNIDIG